MQSSKHAGNINQSFENSDDEAEANINATDEQIKNQQSKELKPLPSLSHINRLADGQDQTDPDSDSGVEAGFQGRETRKTELLDVTKMVRGYKEDRLGFATVKLQKKHASLVEQQQSQKSLSEIFQTVATNNQETRQTEGEPREQIDRQNTEVSHKLMTTSFKIQHGFWMRGRRAEADLFIVLSFDKKTNKYFLEMFSWSSNEVVDKKFIFESKNRLDISVELDDTRRNASILVQEFNLQTQRFLRHQLYLLNSLEFRSTAQSGSPTYKIENGLTVMSCEELPRRHDFYEYSNLIQKFMYDKANEPIKLKLFFQYCEERAFSQAPSVVSQRSNDSIQKLETVLYVVDHLNLHSHGPSKTKTCQVDHPFLNKVIIGVFRMPQKTCITVYEDGHIQFDKKVDHESLHQLILPFPKASKAMITLLGESKQLPMLSMINQRFATVGFVYQNGVWNRQFTIDRDRYDLSHSFGPFMVGVNLQDRTVKILELGGKEDRQIVTEYPIGRVGNPDYKIDAFYDKSNFAIRYEKNTVSFTWYRFEQWKQLYHMRNDQINQVCKEYQIELRIKANKLLFYDLGRLEEGQNHLFDVSLPPNFAKTQIYSFYPIINESQTYLACALSYGRELEYTWREDKYHGILLVDLKKRKVIQNENVDPFKTLIFNGEKQLLCQNRYGIFKIDIVREQFRQISTQGTKNNYIQEPEYDSYSSADSQDFIQEINSSPLLRNTNIGERQRIVTQLVIHSDYWIQESFYENIFFGVRDGKVLCFDVETKSVNAFQDVTKKTERSSLRSGTGQFGKRESIRNLTQEDSPGASELIRLLKPPNINQTFLRFSRWCCNISDCQKFIFVLFSNLHLAYIYTLEFITVKGTENLVQSGQPFMITQSQCLNIRSLNQNQVLCQTISGFTVVNMKTQAIDFKVKFIYTLNALITCSQGVVACPRTTNGILIAFGEKASEAVFYKKETPCQRRKSLMKLSHSQVQQKHAIQSPTREFRNMNDVKNALFNVYGGILKQGYLFIDETMVNWNSRHKLLPVKLMMQDYIVSSEHKDQSGQLVRVDYDYIMTPLLSLTYNNSFTIWEALIRKGLLEGTVEITNHQLDRICNPVLADLNSNILHHLCEERRIEELKQVFNRTDLSRFISQKHKRFPIFFNFNKKSPLDICLDQFDMDSFDILLRATVEFQEGWESSHLILTWLLRAIQLDFDIKILFDSKICTQQITQENFKYSNCFLQQHPDTTFNMAAFPYCITNLLHSSKCYDQVFGKKFPAPAQKDPSATTGHHITYRADYLFGNHQDMDIVRDFIKQLAQTKNMRLFQSEFIQRQILYIWDGDFMIWLKVIFAQQIVSCCLITAIIFLLGHSGEQEKAKWRLILNGINFVIHVAAFYYQSKLCFNLGLRYFTDIQNVIDVLYVIVFVGAILTDASFKTDYLSIARSEAGMEACRIMYSLLVILAYLKLLFLFRLFDNISFIIKMLKQVAQELLPFLFLFLSFIVVFALMIMTLGFEIDGLEEDPYDGLGRVGFLMYVLRTSLGDFEVDTFKQLRPVSRMILWVFWMIIILANTIIFLNFLIAVISDVYEQVMESKTEEIFQKKAQILAQIETVIGNSARDQPTILLTRCGEHIRNQNEWSGFLNEVKRSVSEQGSQFSKSVSMQGERLLKELDNRHAEMTDQLKQLSNRTYNIEHLLAQLTQIQASQMQVQEGPEVDLDQEKLQEITKLDVKRLTRDICISVRSSVWLMKKAILSFKQQRQQQE